MTDASPPTPRPEALPQSAPPALIVAGPTASGKSALAARLAAERGGVVVNADSMQVYRDLPILTAQPGQAERAQAPHRLYGVLDAAERCSAGRWRDMALAQMEAARAAGRMPVLCGGTGLYLKALTEGIAALPPIPAAVRAAAAERIAAAGPAGLHAELAERDPATAAGLHPNDSQRLQRAWEVLEATGRGLASWQAEGPAEEGRGGGPPPWRFAWIVVMPPRADLAAACDRRFDAMLEAGALEEVRALLARGLDPRLPAMKALGVPQLGAYLAGETGLDAAVTAAKTATRRYAKRQATWLRTQVLRHNAHALVMETQFSEKQLPGIFSKIDAFLLTA